MLKIPILCVYIVGKKERNLKIWFTSDFHFGHNNMLTWGGRPFKTVKEMNEYLLDLWNSTIKPQDKVYFLGDLALRDPHPYLPHLKGRIHFIKGNHDQQSDNWYRQQSNIDWVGDLYKFKQGDLYIVLIHYSMRVWPRSHYNSWHLFGHSHGGLNDKNTGKSFDVGIDVWKRILSLEEVIEEMNKRPDNFNYLKNIDGE